MIDNIDIVHVPQDLQSNTRDIREFIYKAVIQLNYDLEELGRRISELEKKGE